MSTQYPGRSGHYWDKSSCITTTRGEYLLDLDYDAEFGEPAVLAGTGTEATPIMKRTVRSYKGTAGASGTLGVFVDWRQTPSAWTDEEYALKGGFHNQRDILIVLRGPVTIVNVGSTEIRAGDSVIPADGGCEQATDTGERMLGKSMQFIPTGMRGLVFVDPDYDKPIADGEVI